MDSYIYQYNYWLTEVKRDFRVFRSVPAEFKDRSFIREMVKNNWESLQVVYSDLVDLELCEIAYSIDRRAIGLMRNEYREYFRCYEIS